MIYWFKQQQKKIKGLQAGCISLLNSAKSGLKSVEWLIVTSNYNSIKNGFDNFISRINRAFKPISNEVVEDVVEKTTVNTINSNTITHIFNKEIHNLGDFLSSYGGDKLKAADALNKAMTDYVSNNKIEGIFEIVVENVNGYNVTIRGKTVDGLARMATAFIPGG